MIILGAFTLLIAAPSFAQEKKEVLPVEKKVETVSPELVKSPQKQVVAEPVTEPKVETKHEFKRSEKLKKIESVEKRGVKKIEPGKIENNE